MRNEHKTTNAGSQLNSSSGNQAENYLSNEEGAPVHSVGEDIRVNWEKEDKFRVSPLFLGYRFSLWFVKALSFLFSIVWYRIVARARFREKVASCLCRLLESLGSTGIKIGQSLSMRNDLIDSTYCNALSSLLDEVEPMETSVVMALVEDAYKRPVAEVFKTFHPVPIGSASIACVYRATLNSGEEVAVKVRRAGIGKRIRADTAALLFIIKFAEALGIVPEKVWSSMIYEVRQMLLEELNFRIEARYTEIFKREAQNCEYVSAPEVYYAYCRRNIIVTEYVEGAFLSEFISAVENGDESSLNAFSARGFDVDLIAERLFHIFFWEVFESNFFHADPHPRNIIVRPNNTLIMIDFGACGTISHKFRNHVGEFYFNLLSGDIYGLCRSIMSSCEPLPPFDTDACLNEMMDVARDWFFAVKSVHSTWEEKCMGGALIKLMSVAGKFGITFSSESFQFMRANFLYDSIIYRLNPGIDLSEVYADWHERKTQKAKQQVLKGGRDRLLGPLGSDYEKFAHMLRVGHKMLHKMEAFIDSPRFTFNQGVGKVSFVLSSVLRLITTTISVLIAGAVARLVFVSLLGAFEGEGSAVLRAVSWVLHSSVFQLFIFAYVAVIIRKILLRLDSVGN